MQFYIELAKNWFLTCQYKKCVSVPPWFGVVFRPKIWKLTDNKNLNLLLTTLSLKTGLSQIHHIASWASKRAAWFINPRRGVPKKKLIIGHPVYGKADFTISHTGKHKPIDLLPVIPSLTWVAQELCDPPSPAHSSAICPLPFLLPLAWHKRTLTLKGQTSRAIYNAGFCQWISLK